jgi:hypothetical protein
MFEFEILGQFKRGHGMVAIGWSRKEIKMTQTSRKKKLRGIVLIPLVTMKPLNGEVKWNNIDLNQKWSGQRL